MYIVFIIFGESESTLLVEHAISTFCWCKLKVYDVESGHIYQINGCLNTESPPNIMMLVIMMSNVKIVEHYC